MSITKGSRGQTGATGPTGPGGGTTGAGAPAGTGTNGDSYWDTTNKRLYRSDGVGWIIMAEPTITTHAPTVVSTGGTITTVGAVTFRYSRHDGWLDWTASIAITTNGTGNGGVRFTLPVAALAAAHLGTGREVNVNGSILSVTGGNGGLSNADVQQYGNAYPGADGCKLQLMGRYEMTTRYS